MPVEACLEREKGYIDEILDYYILPNFSESNREQAKKEISGIADKYTGYGAEVVTLLFEALVRGRFDEFKDKLNGHYETERTTNVSEFFALCQRDLYPEMNTDVFEVPCRD